jgi:hypothetical protein
MNQPSIELERVNVEAASPQKMLREGLLAETAPAPEYIAPIMAEQKPEAQNEVVLEQPDPIEFEEPYHDTYWECVKRLVINCVIGLFMDPIKLSIYEIDLNNN